MSSLKIGIIGGSIAGCAAAVMLQRTSHQIMVFEQSTGNLPSRGAGVCIDKELHQALITQDYVDADMPYMELKTRPFFDGSSGRLLWEQPISGIALNWGVLYRNLRQRVLNQNYYQSAKVAYITSQENQVSLTLVDGRQFDLDLLICADGFDSQGRNLLFPEQFPKPVGYIAWRGLLSVGGVQTNDEYWHQIPYFCFPSGQMLFYYIPDHHERNRYLLNWIIYHRVSSEEIQNFMTDRDGHLHLYAMPPGVMSTNVRQVLDALATRYSSPHMAEIVKRTPMPFIQNIFEINLPYLQKDRILLLGDAGILTRPHAASGAVKALQGVMLLDVILRQEDSIDKALSRWNQEQIPKEHHIFKLGQSFGQALVEHAPLWSQMNFDSMELWWNATIQSRSWYPTAVGKV